MTSSSDDAEAVRIRLLNLLEGGAWEFANRARREGKRDLFWIHRREPTDDEMVDYVVDLLKSGLELRFAHQDDSEGSAWQATDANNIFVKLRIDGGFGEQSSEEFAYIKSIHKSIYPKKSE